VHSPTLRLLLAALLLASAAALPGADAPTAAAKEPVLELPKLQVTAQRAKEIDRELKRLDKMIAREKKKIRSTDLDKTLNNDKLSRAAAIFGGNSAEHLSAVAASRVMLMEQERFVLEAMKRPATIEERKMMDAEIQQLRLTRRNLDDPAAQR
jgi:hypothetical protein